ncbi:hypothetical protein BG003_005765 [Podila horticola]|nr:hypothetical protein BG003_005765 [Podila horticola]
MHRSALFLTLAAVALGASARLNGDAQASGNILSPSSIAARGLDNIDAHLFEHNFIEATLQRRQVVPDISQVDQVDQLADVTKVADVANLALLAKLTDPTKVADVTKLNRRNDVDAHVHADLQRRRLDLTRVVGARALIKVKLFRRHEDGVNAHVVAKTNLGRRDLKNIVSDVAHQLIDVKLPKRADIKDDLNDLKHKVESLVKLDRRNDVDAHVHADLQRRRLDLSHVVGARALIKVKLFRRHEDGVNAHVVAKTNLGRRDLKNIVSDVAHQLIDVKLPKRADIKDDLNDLKLKVTGLVKLDRRSLTKTTVSRRNAPLIEVADLVSDVTDLQDDAGRVVQKRKRTIEGTRIIPRNSDDDDYYDEDSDYDDGENLSEIETEDMKESKDALAPAAADSKKNSGASSILKNAAGWSLVGAAISSLFLWV